MLPSEILRHVVWQLFTDMLPLSSVSKTKLAACLAYSSTLKMKVVHSSKMSVNIYQSTRRNIPAGYMLYIDFGLVSIQNAVRIV
jgi:hypothetical protein